MVFARSQKAAAGLSRAVQERRLEKIYHAVVRGIPEKASDRLEDLLFHDQRRNKTYVVDRERKGVKSAALTYTLLRTAGEYALVRVQLHTGRTHQIRVQFATRKLPLYGDAKYGGKTTGTGFGLWARELTFPHPVSGEILTFTADPPAEEPWNRFT
jgi:23S rRNA pseudouridine1911/1915/1917 synthase